MYVHVSLEIKMICAYCICGYIIILDGGGCAGFLAGSFNFSQPDQTKATKGSC